MSSMAMIFRSCRRSESSLSNVTGEGYARCKSASVNLMLEGFSDGRCNPRNVEDWLRDILRGHTTFPSHEDHLAGRVQPEVILTTLFGAPSRVVIGACRSSLESKASLETTSEHCSEREEASGNGKSSQRLTEGDHEPPRILLVEVRG